MIPTEKFTYGGQEYEVRITKDEKSTFVQVFLNNEPANGYIYRVDENLDYNAKHADPPVDLVEKLVETAIEDVQEKRWEGWIEAALECQKNK